MEPGAGAGALHLDEAYVAAGAVVADDPYSDAGLVVSAEPLARDLARRLASGTVTVSFLPTAAELDLVRDYRDLGVTALAMELVPRISRAQSMDALSSQSLVSGYRCAVVCAGLLRRFLPLNMTAAGTVPPAEVVVLGAGVAGLQAIATARRLGAVVKAYDVRAAAAEEIRSMGAQAIELDLPTLEGAGGYAREMTEERAALQRELLAPYVAAADGLITTAAVPARTAQVLVTRGMVEALSTGSVGGGWAAGPPVRRRMERPGPGDSFWRDLPWKTTSLRRDSRPAIAAAADRQPCRAIAGPLPDQVHREMSEPASRERSAGRATPGGQSRSPTCQASRKTGSSCRATCTRRWPMASGSRAGWSAWSAGPTTSGTVTRVPGSRMSGAWKTSRISGR